MGSLLLVVYALINPPVQPTRANIDTAGRWVVVMTWPESNNDIDLWLRQPDERIVYWRNPRSPQAHLEQDDQGWVADVQRGLNSERMVIRNVLPGEHVINAHAYNGYDFPIRVTVTLWRLEGQDKRVYSVSFVLRAVGDEVTAFRFSLDGSGGSHDLNRLPARLVN